MGVHETEPSGGRIRVNLSVFAERSEDALQLAHVSLWHATADFRTAAI